MRKILFFFLLLAVFLLALAVEWNMRQESKSARLRTEPPAVRKDDVMEVTIGYPSGLRPAGTQTVPAAAPPKAEREPVTQPSQPAASRDAGARGRAAGSEKGPEKHKYIIQKGDTLSGIAAKVLGDESKASLLIKWNHLRNPDLILPGDTLIYYK